MKKIVTLLIFGLMSLASCTEYDEVAMWNKNEDMGSRLAALERLCDRMNTNVASLQRIVEALQANDYVTGVAPVVENGETIGYTISFSRSGPVTIYHGKDGQSGATPVIGVKQDTDGLYYWTLDGEWITDGGKKLPVSGQNGTSPKLKIEEEYWYISYDDGTTWTKLDKATGEKGDDGAGILVDMDACRRAG